MLEPMLSDATLVQGPMRLSDAWCCLDCDVLCTSLERCPSCAGSAIWSVAAWLSPSASVHHLHTGGGSSAVRPCHRGRQACRLATRREAHHVATR
jgi:hypothetical protein